MTKAKSKTLQHEVFLTGVREDIRIVLNMEIAKYCRLPPEQMFNTVRMHEAYRSCNKWLEGLSPYSNNNHRLNIPLRVPVISFTSRELLLLQLLWKKYSSEESEAKPQEEGTPLEAKPASQECAGVYLPDFMTGLTDTHWGFIRRMAWAIARSQSYRATVDYTLRFGASWNQPKYMANSRPREQ